MKKVRSRAKKDLHLPIREASLLLIAVLIAGLFTLSNLGRSLEREYGLHLHFSLRGSTPPPDSALVLAIDEASLSWARRKSYEAPHVRDALSCLDPDDTALLAEANTVERLPRALYACLIETLSTLKPAAIVLDVRFHVTRQGDQKLARTIEAASNVILVEWVSVTPNGLVIRRHPAAALASAAAEVGAFRVDGVGGRTVTRYEAGIASAPSLVAIPDLILRLTSDRGSSVSSEAERLLSFYGPTGTVHRLPLNEFFENPEAAIEQVRDKVIFVGYSDLGLKVNRDHFRTPFFQSGMPLTSGVELMATAYLNRRHNQALVRLPAIGAAAGVGLFALFAFTPAVFPRRRLLALYSIVITAVLVAASVAAFQFGVWTPIFTPVALIVPVAALAYFAARSKAASSTIARLTPKFFRGALDQRAYPAPITADATVVFADLVGSTGVAERMGAERFSDFVNEYYRIFTVAVEGEGGDVVDYKGDGLIALFVAGADDNHTGQAIEALRLVQAATKNRNTPENEPMLMRVGVATGAARLGAMGVEERFTVTALGDVVNLAARLEEHAKSVRAETVEPAEVFVVLDAASASAAGSAVTPLGPTLIRGRRETVDIFQMNW